ncbi:MAG: radical SAM protein [Elusimicrobia bacterium]|nr:radical SAM protein [Elusimicrobiota bacterium]
MRVLLINPPDRNTVEFSLPKAVNKAEVFGCYPPLGLLYVAGAAEQVPGTTVTVIDAVAEKLNYQQLEARIADIQPQVVGIMALTLTMVDVIKTAEVVKRVNKSIHVCLGGPHLGIYPEETVRLPMVDSVVKGEGEQPFKELLECLLSGRDLAAVKGVLFKKDGNIIRAEDRGFVQDLNALPMPARHLTNLSHYWSVLAHAPMITTLMTSRGCPFRCVFCDRPNVGKIYRTRSPANIADEMEQCLKMGIGEFFFYDDTFSIDKRRALGLCEELTRRKLDVIWDIRARVDTVDRELLRALKKAGCTRIHFGVEAGTDSVLRALKKGTTVEQVRATFRACKELKIETLGYFIMGNPTETREQMLETIKLMKELDPDTVHVSVMAPLPATELYTDWLQGGGRHDIWKEFAENPRRDFQVPLWEEKLNREELVDMMNRAYKEFYLRPSYILKQTLKARSLGEIKRKAVGGLSLLKL